MPRLFTALEIPRDAALSLSLLRGGLPGARWIDVENYHLTLRFIGDVEGHVADEIAGALDRVHRAPFSMTLMSAEVPPMSSVRACGTPACRARNAAPITPEAVPDSSIPTQAVLPSAAPIMPPFDFVTIGAAGTPRSASAPSSRPR